ncbi:MAG TPA: kelch repeat-containing protein [Thermoplasmata archaeon]|nr:kelch repeat-containing protein [Thermoplasmata archaeon]
MPADGILRGWSGGGPAPPSMTPLVVLLAVVLLLLTAPGVSQWASAPAAPGRIGPASRAEGTLLAQASASLAAGGGPPGSAGGPGPGSHNWTRLCSAPCAEQDASMAYDVADGYVVYFGGIGTGADVPPFNSPATWIFHAGNWTALNVSAPPYRTFAAMAYDPLTSAVLLFGGCVLHQACAGSGLLADTWSFSSGQWKQLAPTHSPPSRYGASLTYDSSDRALVLFGGMSASGLSLNDSWTFANGTWSRTAATGTAPPGLAFAAFADDPAAGGAILFGGLNGTSASNATWKFAGGTWSMLRPLGFPPASYGGALAFDHRDGLLYLLEGGSATTWKFSGSNWSLGAKVTTSVKFQDTGLVDDQRDGGLILFGGTIGGCSQRVACGSTWEYANHTWREILAFPSDREGAGLAYDATDGYVVLFGGYGNHGFLGDTWRFVADNWTALASRPAPSSRAFPAMTWDAADGYVLLFGGSNATSGLNDTWSFVHGKWTHLHPSAAPAWKGGGLLDYDASTATVILYQQGGTAAVYANRTWSYHSGKWLLLRSAGGPTVDLVDLAYDPSSTGMVGLGNTTNHTGLQTWVYSGGSWVRSATTTEPSRLGEVYYDSVHHWLLLFNSQRGTWEYSAGKWWLLHPRLSPEARYSFGMTFDATDHYVLVFGGYVISADRLSLLGDTWSY